MPDKKITELTAYSTPVDADLIPVVDSTNVITKKITRGDTLTNVTKVRFNTSPSITPVQGDMYWNTDNNSPSIYVDSTNGVTLDLGFENYIRVVNKTGVQINNGEAVYINGVQGNRPTVALAKADAFSTSSVIGIATQDIANNATGNVCIAGEVHGFNTSSYQPNDKLYLSAATAGALTATAPSSPNYVTVVAKVLDVTNNGTILVSIRQPLAGDTTLNGSSNLVAPTQNAVKTYADALISTANALVYKGVIACSGNPNYPAADAGHLYVVSSAGKIGGASGIDVEVGDMIICNTDGTASGDQATVGSYWNIIQKNIVGAVTGPGSAVNNNVVFFDGTTGKVIKDSGITLSGSNTGDQVLPTDQTITITDNTTNNASASKHGWLPKLSGSSSDVLKGDGTWGVGGGGTTSPLTTKGDLYTYTTTNARLAVGTNGQVLSADSSQSAGLKWVEPTAISFVNSETPSGTINGTNTSFTLANSPLSGTLKVFLNGQRLTLTTDYTITGTSLSMVSAPVSGDVLLVDYQINSGSYATGSSSFASNETPVGTVNGTNTTFTLNATPVSDTLALYRDGQLLKGAGNDYTLTGNSISFTTAPVTGSVLTAFYQISVSSAGNADTLDGKHFTDVVNSGWLHNQVFN